MERREKQLISKAQNGDAWAFEQLIAPHHRGLLALAGDILKDEADAQDACQEALLSAYRALPRFRLQSDFFTWLYRIGVNQALKFRRRRHRRTANEASSEVPKTASPRPDHEMLGSELSEHIERAEQVLSAQEHMAFVLCHKRGYKLVEAALLMECSTGAVKSYLFRARRKMQAALRPYLDEGRTADE